MVLSGSKDMEVVSRRTWNCERAAEALKYLRMVSGQDGGNKLLLIFFS